MLIVKRLSSKDTLEIANINHLYDSAFPAYEKRSFQGRQLILNHQDYYLYYFTENEVFIGFVECWKINDFYYVEHFAISSNLRGNGYGQKILQLLSKQVNNIILEIDPVIDEISRKRLRFYQHCGFKQNEYQHFHPSYHTEFAPHQLEVLSFPTTIDWQVYQQFNQKLADVVMVPALL